MPAVGTEGEHGSTRPDMNWHHTTGYGGGDRESSYPGGGGGGDRDRYPTRPGQYTPGYPGPPGRPGMWNAGPPDYGEITELIKYSIY